MKIEEKEREREKEEKLGRKVRGRLSGCRDE